MKPIGYRFQGNFYKCDNATDAFIDIFEKFAEYDETFLTRFEKSNCNNKTEKRHLISKNRDNLYIASPHLTEFSVQMKSGYWIATNYSTNNKISFIKDACIIVGLKYGEDVSATLEVSDNSSKIYVCDTDTRIFVNAANEEICPANASYHEIYFCAYCHGISFLRNTKNRGFHFYHKEQPRIPCPQYTGGGESDWDGDIIDHEIDYKKRLQETICQLRENGNESWLDGQLDSDIINPPITEIRKKMNGVPIDPNDGYRNADVRWDPKHTQHYQGDRNFDPATGVPFTFSKAHFIDINREEGTVKVSGIAVDPETDQRTPARAYIPLWYVKMGDEGQPLQKGQQYPVKPEWIVHFFKEREREPNAEGVLEDTLAGVKGAEDEDWLSTGIGRLGKEDLNLLGNEGPEAEDLTLPGDSSVTGPPVFNKIDEFIKDEDINFAPRGLEKYAGKVSKFANMALTPDGPDYEEEAKKKRGRASAPKPAINAADFM
ncbi:hypothetical protein LQZ21_07635 [Treponema sp. TIM-1]|uniref:hypothetical protein n=1 Tax=Treponema sp. TIM-1 TaxID=2898417 RepID=UPI00397FB539